MLNLDRVIERTEERLKAQGASLQSRQLRALAAVLVGEINRELADEVYPCLNPDKR